MPPHSPLPKKPLSHSRALANPTFQIRTPNAHEHPDDAARDACRECQRAERVQRHLKETNAFEALLVTGQNSSSRAEQMSKTLGELDKKIDSK